MHTRRAGRLLLLLPGGAALLGGLWTGLVRLGVLTPGADLAALHGPLMVSGFLGTVISLERAVALDRPWGYAVPAIAGLGALALLLGLPAPVGALAGVLAAAGLCSIFAVLGRQEPSVHIVVMLAGAMAWFCGALTWLLGGLVATAAWWWAGFLILTIVGERMELNRVRALPRWGSATLVGLSVFLLAALAVAHGAPEPGVRLVGVAMLGLAAWLLHFDVVRRTVRRDGLTRFVAVCLMTGFVWLGIGGALALWHGPQWAGPLYDAQLHAIFVGFVLSMIFGHAPVIFPAVLMLPLRYRPASYIPLLVLHLSLLARVAGDLLVQPELRRWGGVGNVTAVLLFIVLSVASAVVPAWTTPSPASRRRADSRPGPRHAAHARRQPTGRPG